MSIRRRAAHWWVDLPIRHKGLLIVLLPPIFVTLTLVFRLPLARQQAETTALLERASAREHTHLELTIALLQLESSVRAYVLTREASFLITQDETRQRLATLRNELAPAAANLVQRAIAVAGDLVRLVESGEDASSAEAQRLLVESRDTSDALRRELAELEIREDAELAASQAELDRVRASLRPILLLTFFGGFAIALLGAWLFVTGISRRVTALERNAARLARGARLMYEPSRGRDEIGSLDKTLRQASIMLRQRDRELRFVNRELARIVREQQLLNQELEAFSYSVSHDLRAPLRSIDGFAQALREDWGDRLDASGQDHLSRVRNAAQRMARLIDDLLKLSKLTRAQLQRSDVDLSTLARDIVRELRERYPGREVTVHIANGLHAWCDPSLARILLENLLSNAWKFTARTKNARIELTVVPGTRPATFVVRDNGVGFDMRYVEKLFGPFQRLHTEREFPGTGIGLATSRRIVQKHGGEIRTEGEPDKGATFYFTLEAAEASAVVA